MDDLRYGDGFGLDEPGWPTEALPRWVVYHSWQTMYHSLVTPEGEEIASVFRRNNQGPVLALIPHLEGQDGHVTTHPSYAQARRFVQAKLAE